MKLDYGNGCFFEEKGNSFDIYSQKDEKFHLRK